MMLYNCEVCDLHVRLSTRNSEGPTVGKFLGFNLRICNFTFQLFLHLLSLCAPDS